MTVKKIEEYRAAWDFDASRGAIQVKAVGGAKKTLKFNNAAEFSAIATVLATVDGVFYDSSKNQIRTSPEEVGD